MVHSFYWDIFWMLNRSIAGSLNDPPPKLTSYTLCPLPPKYDLVSYEGGD